MRREQHRPYRYRSEYGPTYRKPRVPNPVGWTVFAVILVMSGLIVTIAIRSL